MNWSTDFRREFVAGQREVVSFEPNYQPGCRDIAFVAGGSTDRIDQLTLKNQRPALDHNLIPDVRRFRREKILRPNVLHTFQATGTLQH